MMMRRIAILLLLLTVVATPYAQQRRTGNRGAKTTQTRKAAATTRQTTKAKTTTKAVKTVKPTSVQALEKQRKQIQQQIKEQERRLRTSQKDVERRLQNLMIINTEIDGKRKTIDTIRQDIAHLEHEIEVLGQQLEELQEQLATCKERYVKSLRYMHRNRNTQSQLMFIFSADNLGQMYRRLRFMREYAAYQHVQGDEVKTKQEEVNKKFQEISRARNRQTQLLAKGEQEKRNLESKQEEQQVMVKNLQKEQKTIQGIIDQQRKKDAALNAEIDRLIAEEIARQKARAAAEAKRRAEAEAARKRAEAEAANKKQKGGKAVKSPKEPAGRDRVEASVTPPAEPPLYTPSEDVRISGNFESNRGRLPIPVTGAYRIVSHFGQYNVEGLHNVRLDNKGINIKAEAGAQARSIFDGEVSAVFSFGGTMVVMVRHGSYISVYCNLASVSVQRGQRVSTRQALGRLANDNILQFQLRRETAKLNPEHWLGR